VSGEEVGRKSVRDVIVGFFILLTVGLIVAILLEGFLAS
jgi:hypothetical protein